MKGERFTEEQIIGVLKEAEAGAGVKDVCRRHGVSEQSVHLWKAKYGAWRSAMPNGFGAWRTKTDD